MPTLHVTTNAATEAPPALLPSLSRAVAEATGKDERWVMVALAPAPQMTYGGEAGPTCFARVVNIGGYTDEAAKALAAKVTALLAEHLQVPPERIYVELSEAERPRFAWKGNTFG